MAAEKNFRGSTQHHLSVGCMFSVFVKLFVVVSVFLVGMGGGTREGVGCFLFGYFSQKKKTF